MTDAIFRLSLLGRFEFAGREGPVVLGSRKVAGLLSVLALTSPTAQPRERLATLLWGSHPEQQSRQNLRQALFRLRRVLGQQAIAGGDDAVMLRDGVVHCDAARMLALIRDGSRAALAEAAELYQGPLLADVSIPEESWCDWVEELRRSIDTQAQDAMLRLAELELATGQPSLALSVANRILSINNLREDAHRVVMRALAAMGRRADALKHYDSLAGLLKRELDTLPDPSTRALMADLLGPGPAVAAVPAAVALAASAAPARPSVAVLAFANMGGDPGCEYLSDGIAEDIITELSRFSDLLVIARNSSFQYKGRSVDARTIGRELGVRYILEGSLRFAGERVRITAQLVESETGAHLWADHYDRVMTDIFRVQDEVARTIVSVLAAHVSKAEEARTILKPPSDWQAYNFYMRARQGYAAYFTTARVGTLYEVRELLNRALALDPGYSRALAMLADSHVTTAVNPLDVDFMQRSVLDRANELALAAVQRDPNLPEGHIALGRTLLWKRQHAASISALSRAAELNPNLTDWRFAASLCYAGEPERALATTKAHMRLDPFYLPSALMYLGHSLFMLERYEEALGTMLEVASRLPHFASSHKALAATYDRLGQPAMARAEAAEVLRLEPGYTIAAHRRLAPYKRAEDAAHYFDALRSAGLPEG